jgi:hypothetical protein
LASTEAEKSTDDAGTPEADRTEEAANESGQLAWTLAVVLLAVLTVANAGWTFREPLAEKTGFTLWRQQADSSELVQDGLLKDPQSIQLISRDMHTHPTRSGILVLSLTFVNLAQRSQVFPDLEITLLDAANQAVARRRLLPDEYLRPGADITAGLAADVYLPVLLEFGDPGDRAVGFEIRFL